MLVPDCQNQLPLGPLSHLSSLSLSLSLSLSFSLSSLSLSFSLFKFPRTQLENPQLLRDTMKCSKLVLVLVSLQTIAALLPHGVVADGMCSKVNCGMGSCNESSDYVFGFACQCKSGWSRFHLGDVQFPFLPCVIPNCTINYSCQNGSQPPPPSPPPPAAPPLTNLSIFDPCLLEYCGGGTCEKASEFGHRCACRDGFRNLLDDAAYPCYQQCSLGSDCAGLGIGVLNGSKPGSAPPAPVSFTITKSGAAGSSSASAYRLQELLMVVSFFWVQAIW